MNDFWNGFLVGGVAGVYVGVLLMCFMAATRGRETPPSAQREEEQPRPRALRIVR